MIIIIIIILVVVISENFIIYSMNYCHTVFCEETSRKKRDVCVFVLKRTLFTFLNVSSPPLQTTPKRRISTPTSFDDDARAHISIIVSFNNRVY